MANIADENTFNPERTLSKIKKANDYSSVAPDYADLEKLSGGAKAAPQQQPASNNERKTKHGAGQGAETPAEQAPTQQKKSVWGLVATTIEVVETAKAEWQRIKSTSAQQPSAESQSVQPKQQDAPPSQPQQGGYAKVADKLPGIKGALKDIGNALEKAGVGSSSGSAPSVAGRGAPQQSTGTRTPGG